MTKNTPIVGIMSHGKIVPVWEKSDEEIITREIKHGTPVEDITKMLKHKRTALAVNIHAREMGFKKIPTYASIKRAAEKTKASNLERIVREVTYLPQKRSRGRPRNPAPVVPVKPTGTAQKGSADVETLLTSILNEQRVGNRINSELLNVWKNIQSTLQGRAPSVPKAG